MAATAWCSTVKAGGRGRCTRQPRQLGVVRRSGAPWLPDPWCQRDEGSTATRLLPMTASAMISLAPASSSSSPGSSRCSPPCARCGAPPARRGDAGVPGGDDAELPNDAPRCRRGCRAARTRRGAARPSCAMWHGRRAAFPALPPDPAAPIPLSFLSSPPSPSSLLLSAPLIFPFALVLWQHWGERKPQKRAAVRGAVAALG